MRASLALAALTGVASAGTSTTAYTDPKTQIDFQQFSDASGFAFGVALPKSPGKDFIGQIVAPGSGWGGVSLTSSMMASVLIAAWPNGDAVVGSIRKTNSYVNPSVDSSGPVLYPIEKGTFVNSTHYCYTFLCKNCITGGTDAFDVTTTTAVLGWALSDTAPSTPSSASSVLKYHATGFGEFGLKVADAESANYATWVQMATSATNGTTSTPASTPSSTPSTPSTLSTPSSTPITLNTTYDYIVVGAGDAGIVVAERLAESSASVLLIERGGKSMASTGGSDRLSWNSSLTPYDVPAYGYAVQDTADTSYCADTASTAGCILGGSTVINAEMFVPPQEADFENWPQGWQWSDVQESASSFYARNPGSTKPSADGKRYFQDTFSIMSRLLEGNGWSEVDAIAQPDQKHMVYSHPPMNIVNSTRAGPVLTYLPLAEQYPNFKLQLDTKVLRVVRSGASVSGVEIQLSSGQTEIVPLSKNGKVILAAGALSTPRLLINSGIGPRDQIQTVNEGTSGISVNTSDVIELPVGKSLKDHPIFTITVDVASNISVFDATEPSTAYVSMYAQGAGPLAEGMQRLNFWSSVDGSDGVTRFIQGTVATASASSIKIKVYLTHGATSEGVLGMASDGSTTFVTKPWLTTAADKAAITTFLTDFLAYIDKSSSLSIESITGGNVTAADLISSYVTGDHFVGTAKMGTDDGRANGTAVVDTDCKVYGTDNLYVVDASIHPDLPTGNTQAIIAVVAEHAAKVISGLASASSIQVAGQANASTPAISGGRAAPNASTPGVYTQLVTSTIEGQTTVYTTVQGSATGVSSQVAGGQAAPDAAQGGSPTGVSSQVAGGQAAPDAAQGGSGQSASPLASGQSGRQATSVVRQIQSATETVLSSVVTVSAGQGQAGNGVSVITSVWTSTIPASTAYVTKTMVTGSQQGGASGQGSLSGQAGQASGQGSLSGQAGQASGQGSLSGQAGQAGARNGNKPMTSIFTVVATPQTTVSTVYFTQAAQGSASSGNQEVVTQILTSTIPASTSYYTTVIAASATIPAYTTSTVYATSVRTVTSCAASITNCPARSQSVAVVTDVVAVTTTICPVTAAQTRHATPSTLQTVAAVSGVPTPVGGGFNLPANWSSIVPPSALNETIATPTPIEGVETPEGQLPKGFTVRDLLEWVTYVIESVWQKGAKA